MRPEEKDKEKSELFLRYQTNKIRGLRRGKCAAGWNCSHCELLGGGGGRVVLMSISLFVGGFVSTADCDL